MKKIFQNRLEAIKWIVENVEDEGQFEVLRERLNFNHIYTGSYFIDLDKDIREVVLIDPKK